MFINHSGFGILRLLAGSNKWSVSDLGYLFGADPIMSTLALLHYYTKNHTRLVHAMFNTGKSSVEVNF